MAVALIEVVPRTAISGPNARSQYKETERPNEGGTGTDKPAIEASGRRGERTASGNEGGSAAVAWLDSTARGRGPSCRRRRGRRRPSRPLRRRQVFRSSFYLRSGAALQPAAGAEGRGSSEQQSLMKSARSRFLPVSSPIPILELESRFWMLLLDSSKPSAKSSQHEVRERREVESLERVRVV